VTELNKKTLFKVFSSALRIRMVEERIAELYPKGNMRCPTHLSIGQELPPVMVSQFLRDEDTAVSSHRCHAHYLAKGGNLNSMIAEIHGKKNGCSSGKGGSMHLVDQKVGFMGATAIVGGSIPIGVGLGLAHKLKSSDNISCIYFGDGATEEGVYYESLNFAAVRKLPTLFICEQNRYSVYSPLQVRQPNGRSISGVATEMGVKSVSVDGFDVEKTLHLVADAIRHVRKNKAPFLIEFSTYRYREHCGPFFDNNLGYRSEIEYQSNLINDPLIDPLSSVFGSTINEKKLKSLTNNISKEIDEAFSIAKHSKFPPLTSAMEGEFA